MTDDHLRYGRLPLTGSLDQFHHAINALKADTCDRGQCDHNGRCGKHQRRMSQRHLRAVADEEVATG